MSSMWQDGSGRVYLLGQPGALPDVRQYGAVAQVHDPGPAHGKT